MSQNENLTEEDTERQQGERPCKNEAVILADVNKDKLATSQPEDENQLSRLVNNAHESEVHVSSIIKSIETKGWILQNEKEKIFKIEEKYVCDDDQFFHGQELYDYKETSHKFGALDYRIVPDLPSGKEDEAHELLDELYAGLGSVTGDRSYPAGLQLPPKIHTGILATLLQRLPAAKDAYNLKVLSDLQHLLKQCLLNSELKDRSQVEDQPDQRNDHKETPQTGSGPALKNLMEVEQYLPYVTSNFLNKSGYASEASKKNLLYSLEDTCFNLRHVGSLGDRLASYETFVSDQDHSRSAVVSNGIHEQSQKTEKSYSEVFGSKTSQCSFGSHDVRIKLSLDMEQSWIDNSEGIPDSSVRQVKVKPKEDLGDFALDDSGIEKNFPDHIDLKRKNSIDLPAGELRGYENDGGEERWINVGVDAVLKLDMVYLACRPDSPHMEISKLEPSGDDEQDIFSSLTEDPNLAMENCREERPEETVSAANQILSSSNTAQGKDTVVEQGNAESHSNNLPTKHDTDNDTSTEASHHSAHTVEGSWLHPYSTHGIDRGSTPHNTKPQLGETTVKQFLMNETLVTSEQDSNRNTESAAADNPSCTEEFKSEAEENANSAVDQKADSVPSEGFMALPVSEDAETPAVSFHAPVQVSSAGNCESVCAAYTDLVHESSEESSFSNSGLCQEDPEVGLWQSHTTVTVQETQSHRDQSLERWQTSMVTQEQACCSYTASPVEWYSIPGTAEETPFSHLSQEQPHAQCESPLCSHPGFSATQELHFSQISMPSGARQQPESVLSPHAVSGASCTVPSSPSHLQSFTGYPSPPHVQLPPVTVHAASSLPPWAATTPLIDLTRAADRNFAALRKRRATFGEDWPSNHSGIDATNVALAGFFFVGPGRRVRCFYCGLELDGLTPAHNVWDEHVRHRPDCLYFNVITGREVVQETPRHLHHHEDD